MNNIFERASRLKLRFETSKGLLSTEDLWDLSLTSLDSIAKATNKKLKEESEESFIATKTTTNTTLELKMEVLKHVIKVKMEAAEAAKVRAEKLASLGRLKELAANKADQQLSEKSLDDLNKMIAETEASL